MEKWADYLISNVLYKQAGDKIDKVIARKDNGDNVGDEVEMSRNTLIQHFASGKTFATMTKKSTGKWHKLYNVHYTKNYYNDFISINSNPTKDNLGDIPLYITKRKTFISYYHKDDEQKRIEFENLTDDIIVNKSVANNDIDSDNSDDYIKQLIQKEYLKDTTVLVVLIGNKTKCRKHVDWEISGALNYKVGNTYAGLLGLILPSHPDFGTGKATYDLMPARLADNFKTGYAVIADWTENRKTIQSHIELAFDRRSSLSEKRDNSRAQMQKNTCE
jgi:hypothetical protein